MDKYIKYIIKEAKKAYRKKEIPVGAIIVKNNKVIAKAHNNRQSKKCVIGHAEIQCILKAEKKLGDWRLNGCELYVTLKPCKMCKLIINESRIDKVYYLIDKKTQENIIENTNFEIVSNIYKSLKLEYENLINNFFKKLRINKDKN